MKDWDDLRFFLTVAREGSVTAAAVAMNVNHSTVSRRIAAFEQQHGARLFERLRDGYVLTPAGEDMLSSVKRIEKEIATLDRRTAGRDARLSGVLRVTAPKSIAVELLMPHLAAFSKKYPEIEVQSLATDAFANLFQREADVAVRSTNTPPETLVGRRLTVTRKAIYASVNYLKQRGHTAESIVNAPDNAWIWWEKDMTIPRWIKDYYPKARLACRVNAQLVIVAAAKAGMGIAELPCCFADREPELCRVPPFEPRPDRDLWVLTHPDLRRTARVRAFMDFMAKGFARQRDLFTGRAVLPALPTTPDDAGSLRP